MQESPSSMVQDLVEFVRKYRSGNRGKDRTILRNHLLHRLGHTPSVCRYLDRTTSERVPPHECVPKYIPTMTNHSGFFTRSPSAWGSLNDSTLTLSASLISSAVRWRTKTGLPRHLMMTYFPSVCLQYRSIGCLAYVLSFWDGG